MNALSITVFVYYDPGRRNFFPCRIEILILKDYHDVVKVLVHTFEPLKNKDLVMPNQVISPKKEKL